MYVLICFKDTRLVHSKVFMLGPMMTWSLRRGDLSSRAIILILPAPGNLILFVTGNEITVL